MFEKTSNACTCCSLTFRTEITTALLSALLSERNDLFVVSAVIAVFLDVYRHVSVM